MNILLVHRGKRRSRIKKKKVDIYIYPDDGVQTSHSTLTAYTYTQVRQTHTDTHKKKKGKEAKVKKRKPPKHLSMRRKRLPCPTRKGAEEQPEKLERSVVAQAHGMPAVLRLVLRRWPSWKVA